MSRRIIGAKGGGGKGGGGGGSAVAAVIAKDSLRSKAYARVLDLVSEGEIEGLVNGAQSIYLDGTPLQNSDGSFNFSSVTWATRNGTQSQSYIPGFPAVENTSTVGVEVKHATSVTRTFTNQNLNAVRVTVGIPSLINQNTSNGNVSGTAVEIAIDVQTNGGGFVRQYLSVGSGATGISGNIASGNGFKLSASVSASGYSSYDWWSESYTSTSPIVKFEYRLNGGAWTTISEDYIYEGVASVETPTFPATYLIELRATVTNAGGTVSIDSAQVLTPVQYDVITGKTSSRYQRSYNIPLTGTGPWDIRLVRNSPDSTSDNLQNKTWWDSATEIINTKLRYPNSALVGISVDASQFNSIPTRAYDMKLLRIRVPTNYNPATRTYTGSWDGTFKTAWTNNPAWCFYDMVTTARYGLGKFINTAQVDKWALYAIGQYCDQFVPDGFGGFEPRFTCNMYIQTRQEAYKLLSDMASIFRGMSFWSSGSITAVQDAPTTASYLYTAANVIDGVFNYMGSSAKARHTVALVTWNDMEDMGRQKVEYVEDLAGIARYGVITTEIAAIGCTSRGQANRVGRWLLYSERLETETVSFKTGIEGMICRPGQVIKVADPARAGVRYGGRIITTGTSSITLDAPVTLTAGQSYTLSTLKADGTVQESTVSHSGGTLTTLSVSPAFSQAPAVGGVWILTSTAVNPQTFRVITVVENDKHEFEVVALAHDPYKFAAVETGLTLQPRSYSVLSAIPASPTGGTVTESLYQALTDVKVMAQFSWASSGDSGISYVGTWTLDGNNPVEFFTRTVGLQLNDAQPGNYTITIQSVNSIGIKSAPYTFVKSVLGKTAPPADVTGLQMTVQGETGVLQWNLHPDLDVRIGGQISVRYSEELVAARWSTSIPVGDFPGSTSSGSVPMRTGTYLVKAVDSLGNGSVNATSVITDAPNILQFNAVASSTQEPTFAGAKTGTIAVNGRLILDNAIYLDDIVDFDLYITPMDGGGLVATGEYEFDSYVDTGAVYTSRVTSTFNILAYAITNLVDQWGPIDSLGTIDEGFYDPDFVDAWVDFDVIVNFDVATDTDDSLLQIYISTTNDNPAASPTWSDWRIFYIGDYTARAFKFKVQLNRGIDTSKQVALTNLGVTVDVPDRIESANNVLVPATGLAITFANAFYLTPAIAVTAENMATGDYTQITAKSATGFTIVFKNSAGSGVARTMDWIAKGFGYQN